LFVKTVTLFKLKTAKVLSALPALSKQRLLSITIKCRAHEQLVIYYYLLHLCASCEHKVKNSNCTPPTPDAKYGQLYLNNPAELTGL